MSTEQKDQHLGKQRREGSNGSSNQSSLFSSKRERRLWSWTLAAVAAIFATLIFGSTLAGILSQDLAAIGFVTGMLLVGATILTQGLKTKPKGLEIAVGLGIAVVYLMLFLRIAIPERSHLIEYSVVAIFIYEALTERATNGRRVYVPALLAVFLTAVIGTLDESIQIFLPSRVFDPQDIFFNGFAAFLAVGASFALSSVRRLARKTSR